MDVASAVAVAFVSCDYPFSLFIVSPASYIPSPLSILLWHLAALKAWLSWPVCASGAFLTLAEKAVTSLI